MVDEVLRKPAKGKDRELRIRDEFYFDVARRIFLEKGFHALTLGRVAEETGFSKATVYLRFRCKEELIAELGLRCEQELLSIVERGLQFPGRPRERMLAMGECVMRYAQHYADNIRIRRTIDAEAVFPKVSPALQTETHQLGVRLFRTLMRPIEEAIAEGDLKFGPGVKPQSLCFALWIMVEGWAFVVAGAAPLEEFGLPDLMQELVRNVQCLFDGVGWRPLTNEWDYDDTSRRIGRTLFPEVRSEELNQAEVQEPATAAG